MSWQTGIGIALSVLDGVAILHAVLRGRAVEATLAWVFAILAFPGVGAVAYLALSSPSIKRTTRRKRRATSTLRGTLAERVATVAEVPEGSVLQLATALTGLGPTAGNRVRLMAGDERALDEIEAAVRAAQRSIWAEYYIIRRDATGRRFLALLAEKAAAGVEVRLLYDAVGSLRIDGRLLAAITAAGGHAQEFLPLNPLRRRWALQLRNHRKIIIVDGALGFTGGMNIGDEHSGSGRRRGALQFRDTHLALHGPAVGDLAQIFAEDWTFATGEPLEPLPPPEPVNGSVVAIVPSGPDQEHNANGLVFFTGITQARRRVYLASPYFIPDEATLRALIGAALRGVDVRVLLPETCDVALVGPASRFYEPVLVRAGVRIFRYRIGTLHAKTLVVDGEWGVVGSANLDVRSFRLNFELGALVVDPNFAHRLEARFLEDLAGSREVTAAALARVGVVRRLLYGAARLLSPLL